MTLPDTIKPGWFTTERIGAWPVCRPQCPSRRRTGLGHYCTITAQSEGTCRPAVGAMAKELGLPTAQPRGGGTTERG